MTKEKNIMFSADDLLKYFQEESWIQLANPFITLKKKKKKNKYPSGFNVHTTLPSTVNI